MKSAGNRGVVQSRLQMLHIHVLLGRILQFHRSQLDDFYPSAPLYSTKFYSTTLMSLPPPGAILSLRYTAT